MLFLLNIYSKHSKPLLMLFACSFLLCSSEGKAALALHVKKAEKPAPVPIPVKNPGFATSPAPKKDSPVLVNADTISYDKENNSVTASGHVELYQEKRLVLADRVRYNKKTDTVVAEGNVSVLEPNGDVFFADQLQFTDQMKNGIVQHFRARFVDNSLLAANSATRVNEHVTQLKKAVYSPCTLCKTDPTRPPVWQIKADKVTIDKEKQKVSYRNAFFEAYGVPVMYTPVFSHAMPGADRKSGFLIPTYSHITSLGSTVKIPYYVDLGPSMDTTLTPYLTTAEGPVMIGEFRQLTEHGGYTLNGSITNPTDYRASANDPSAGRRIRGHLQGEGLFHLPRDMDVGFNFKQASDDTYLSRYKFGDEDFLTTRVYAEHIKDRDYTLMQGLSFQDLTATSDSSKPPLILPLFTSHKEGKVSDNGARWTIDSNAMALSRNAGTDSRRLSSTLGWSVPYITTSGHVFNATTSIRSDLYNVSDVVEDPANPNRTTSGGIVRFIPQTKIDWRFPLVKEEHNYHILLEPTANVIVSPYGGNPEKIPNEDSQEIELSDNNLFNDNRFTGLDRVEEGPRTNYGIRSTIRNGASQSADFLFGQSYRLKEESELPKGSGLNDNFSDYVGRVGVKPNDMLDVAYRFRLDNVNLNPHRNEIDTTFALSPVVWNVSYIFLNDNAVGSTPERKQIYSSASFALSKQWTITADARRDLSDGGGMISSGGSLLYTGDCVNFTTALSKQFTRDQDIQPATSITFQIFLKNLN